MKSLGRVVLSVMLKLYMRREGEVPFEIKFVDGNTASCGTPHTIHAFFIKERGKTHLQLPLQSSLCDCSTCPSVSAVPPHDVVVVRLNDTAMIVSFRELTIVKANSCCVAYYISYIVLTPPGRGRCLVT